MRIALIAVLATSCTSVRNVPHDELARIKAGGLGEAVVLDDGNTRARLGPNTALRFTFTDGTQSPWLWASDLETNDEGARVGERWRHETSWRNDGPYVFAWSDVASVEAENYSGSKTLAYLGANAALAIVLAPLAIAGGFDLPGLGTAPARHRMCRMPARQDGAKPAKIADATASAMPDPKRDGSPTPPETLRPSRDDVVISEGRSLFSDAAERRAIVQVVTSVDGSALQRIEEGASTSLFAGARFYDAFELGLTGSRVSTPTGPGYALSFRTGAHFHLDGDYFFAIPLFVEVGKGPGVDSMFRVGYGLRVRFTRALFGGVYAYNPRYTNLAASIPSAATQGWHFAHGLELGATF